MKTSGRPLLIAMALVVLAFLGTAAYTARLSSSIGALAEEIDSNASPSIAWLVRIRSGLLHLDTLIDHYREGTDARVLDDLEATRAALGDALVRYEALPAYPDEAPLQGQLRDKIAGLDRAIRAALDRSGTFVQVQDALEDADRVNSKLVEVNVRRADQNATSIARDWRRSTSMELVLDLLCLGLALLATTLAILAVRRHERALHERAEELDKFAGRMAHDILSPLTSVGMALAIAGRRTPHDEQLQVTIARGNGSLQTIQRLVNGLLDFARAGAHPAPTAKAMVREAIDGVMPELEERARSAGIALEVPEIDAQAVACEFGVLTSILSNLIGNAIKYMGPATERKIDVRVRSVGEKVVFEVADTGPGIPREAQTSIFEPYVRGPRAESDGRIPGIGLGLATVRRLVEAHAGVVGFRERRPKGSVFWFEMPIAASER
jgi:signal transduction histidine kinase